LWVRDNGTGITCIERTNFEPFTLDGLKQSVKDDVEIPLVARVLKQVPELEAVDKLFIYLL
jgi:hypothetical protein